MFTHLFNATVKYLFVPLVVILLLQNTSLGVSGASLLASIALTACGLPWLLWIMVRFLPNMALLRGKRLLELMAEVTILISAIVGFWIWYFIVANR